MKHLYLFRHAKTEEQSFDKNDFERNLIERGVKDITMIALNMKKNKWDLDFILSSPAYRTKQTSEILKENLNKNCSIFFEPTIYQAKKIELEREILHLPQEYDRIALVGHNPGMAELVSTLDSTLWSFPTSALLYLTLDIDEWLKFDISKAKMVAFISPKDEKYYN